MITDSKTIQHVADQRLCTSCGACSAVCPVEAVSFEETAVGGHVFPVINEGQCTHCGLCLSVCPGVHFGKTLMERMPEDPFRGTAIGAFVGKATDEEIYNNSQSGGVASALALYMLESGQADGVVTVVMEWGDPPRAKVHLARNKENIFEAQKSKYCPVPVLEVLRQVEKEGLERLVLIGTSCQIHGLLNIKDVVPRLGNRVVLTIGLFCTHVMTCAAIDHLMSETEMNKAEVDKHLIYRDKNCGGYPGNVHIRDSDGGSVVLAKERRFRIKNMYIPARCWLCFDGVNVFSDISVGDPWKLEDVDRENGETVSVSRTEIGHEILQQALEKGVVEAREVNYKDVADGQSVEAIMRGQWRGCVEAWKGMGRPLPDYCEIVGRSAPEKPEETIYRERIENILCVELHPTRKDVMKHVEEKAESSKPKPPWFHKRVLRFGKRKIKQLFRE